MISDKVIIRTARLSLAFQPKGSTKINQEKTIYLIVSNAMRDETDLLIDGYVFHKVTYF